MIPQFIYLTLMVVGLTLALAKHGEKQKGEYNFFTTLITTGISFWILYEGGFFNGVFH